MPPTVEIPDLKSTFACEEAPSLARLLFPHQEIMAQGSPVTAQCGYINLLDMGLSEMTINRTLGRERESGQGRLRNVQPTTVEGGKLALPLQSVLKHVVIPHPCSWIKTLFGRSSARPSLT